MRGSIFGGVVGGSGHRKRQQIKAYNKERAMMAREVEAQLGSISSSGSSSSSSDSSICCCCICCSSSMQ